MIRLACNLSKKVPIPGCDFSSQSYGAALDIEIADSSDVQTIQSRLQQMYRVLEQSIDTQITDTHSLPTQPLLPPQPTSFLDTPQQPTLSISEPTNGNSSRYDEPSGNGNGTRIATSAQVKAVYAIIKAQSIHRDYLNHKVLPRFNVNRPEDLTVAQASEVIKHLKGLNNGTLHDRGKA